MITNFTNFKLFEGRYDKLTGLVADSIWNIIKVSRTLYDKFPEKRKSFKKFKEVDIDTEFKTHKMPIKLKDFEFDLSVKIRRDETIIHKLGFIIDGLTNAEDGTITIKIEINPEKEPKCYKELNSFLQDVIRHEIEHLTHDGMNRILDRPDPQSTYDLRVKLLRAFGKGNIGDSDKYYLLEDELVPLVQGMYRKAKTDKKPLGVIFREFLDIMVDDGFIDKSKVDKIYGVWVEYAKRLLPAAKFDY